MTSWNPIDEPFDKCRVGGFVSPGICEIVGASSPRNWEERIGPGLSGSIVVFRGVRLSHFSIKFHLVTREHWDEWNTFQPIVAKPPFGKRPRALDVVHPILEPLGIRAVVIEDVMAPEQVNDGDWVVELKVIDFRRPKYGLAVPEGSQQTPADPYEEAIAGNTAEIDALNAELAQP